VSELINGNWSLNPSNADIFTMVVQVRTKLGVGKKGRKASLPVVEPLVEEHPLPVSTHPR